MELERKHYLTIVVVLAAILLIVHFYSKNENFAIVPVFPQMTSRYRLIHGITRNGPYPMEIKDYWPYSKKWYFKDGYDSPGHFMNPEIYDAEPVKQSMARTLMIKKMEQEAQAETETEAEVTAEMESMGSSKLPSLIILIIIIVAVLYFWKMI